jgi:hypothetical protein
MSMTSTTRPINIAATADGMNGFHRDCVIVAAPAVESVAGWSGSTIAVSWVPGDAKSPERLANLVRARADDPDGWQPHVRLPDLNGQRWWTRLSAESDADVWLLSWLPGQATELHDHGPSAAAFAVVRGEPAEVRVDTHG